MQAAHGADVLVAALERAVAFGRFRAHDVRSILAAGHGCPTTQRSPVTPSSSTCPLVPMRRSLATTPSGRAHEHDPAATRRRHRSRAAPAAARRPCARCPPSCW